MPPLAPVPLALKAQFQHTIAGIPAWVHWYFQYSGTAPVAADAAATANSLKSAWVTNFAPLAHPQVTLVQVQVTDLASPTGGQGVSGGTAVGTRTGGPLTANDCAMVNLHFTRRYRGGKPRQYWPFGTQTDIATPQTWATTFQAAVNTAWNAVNAAAAAITWAGGGINASLNVSYWTLPNRVITSPTTGRARNVPTARTTPLKDIISSATCNQRIATQRRRQHFSA
jgi:hypothetical protein